MYNVLFLASWYPSRVDPYDGDFIERHARAIGLNHRVFVIYLVKDPFIQDGRASVRRELSGNVTTFRCYYPYSGSKNKWVEKWHSNRTSLRLFKRLFEMISRYHGMPDVVHLNVLMKAGIFALHLKEKYCLPFVLSENWTGYYPSRKDGFAQKGFLYRQVSEKIYKSCDLPLPVSHDLGMQMNRLFGINKEFKVVPNVVDTDIFYPDFEVRNRKKRFIHVSTLGFQKNIWGILYVVRRLFQQRQDFELHVAGNAPENILLWTKANGLYQTCVYFTGQISYREVADNLRKSDVLVMFSRYENLPCVVLEALCCGLPVISTDVGGVREVINRENGVLIGSEKEEELLRAFEYMLENRDYDKRNIAMAAKARFNYRTVAGQFDEAYQEVLESREPAGRSMKVAKEKD